MSSVLFAPGLTWAAGETAVTLFRTYSGRIDYVVTGESFRTENNFGNWCDFVGQPGTTGPIANLSAMTTSAVLNMPASSTVLDAFLYFAGSQGAGANLASNTSMTLNGNAISTSASGGNEADYQITGITGSNIDFFGGKRDVKNIVRGPGVYTFAGLDVDTTADGRPANQTCLGAWALVVIYEDPALTTVRVLNLFDGFRDFQNSSFPLQPRNFVIRDGAFGQMTHVSFEGDASLNDSIGSGLERFSLQVPAGTGPVIAQTNSLNPITNQYNSTRTGPDVLDIGITWGLDVDTYDITPSLVGQADVFTATTIYDSAQDLVLLTAEMILVENKDIADIEVTNNNITTFIENNTGTYRFSVVNNGDGTGSGTTGFATGFILLYNDLPVGITITDPASDITTTGWDCNTNSSAPSTIRCIYELSTLPGGQLDSFTSLPDIDVVVNIADQATTGASVTSIVRVINCDVATLLSPCRDFNGKHSNPEQFDNVNFFTPSEDIFDIDVKSANNNNVDAEVTNILLAGSSDLSTSTKEVIDLNGGDVEVGDTLEYTITLVELSGNVATNVEVQETLDADTTFVFGSYNVTGSSYTLSGTSATNITVPASGTVIIKFRVTVNTGTEGKAVDNTALVVNPSGDGASPSIPTQFISLGAIIGNKPLYLDDIGGAAILTRIPPGLDSTTTLAVSSSINFDLSPAIPTVVAINSGNLAITIWIENSTPDTAANLDMAVELFNGAVSIGSDSNNFTIAARALPGDSPVRQLVPFIINTAGFTTTNPDNINLTLTNNSGTTTFIVAALEGINSSIVTDASTVINTEEVKFYTASGGAIEFNPPGAGPLGPLPGQTVFIRATVHDPFGEHDIEPLDDRPDITLTDPLGSTTHPVSGFNYSILAGTPTRLDEGTIADGIERKTYEWTFSVPVEVDVPRGDWTVKVDAHEGQEGAVVSSLAVTMQTGLEPNLTTSVKSVVNLDDNVNRPGNTLRYTISLVESNGGIANDVSIIDFIPPVTGNLNIVSIPVGAIDNSTSSVVNITNITIPANSTEIIEFEVEINQGTAEGTRIDNTAEVTNPFGPSINPSAPSLFVYGAPSAGSKLLYLDDLGISNVLTRDEDESDAAADSTSIELDGLGSSVTIVMTPPTRAPLELGAGSINVNLWLHRNNQGAANPRFVDLTLGYRSGSGGGGSSGTIDTASQQIIMGQGSAGSTLVTFVMIQASNITLNTNTEIFLRATNSTPADDERYTITSFLNSVPSTIVLNALTVINVDSITIFDDGSSNVNNTPVPGQNIDIVAVISDPFGEADIETVNNIPTITLTDPDGNSAYSPTLSELVESPVNLATRTYQWDFLVPSSGVTQGNWNIVVEADEGREGTIANIGATSFNTASVSDLSQSTKSVVDKFGGDPEPGDVLEYTVTLVNSNAVPALNVSVTDVISSNLGNFNVLSIPGGANDLSTPITGPLNINNITVPALSSVAIVFEVTIIAGLNPGDTIDNTAGISNPNGLGANPLAPTVIVSPSLIPSSGNKPLYLEGSNGLTRNQIASDTETLLPGAVSANATYTLNPITTADLTLAAGPIPVTLWVDGDDRAGVRLVIISLDYSGASNGNIDSKTQAIDLDGFGTLVEFTILFNLASDLTLLAGTEIKLSVTNASSKANQDFDIHTYSGSEFSRIDLNSNTVINVEDITIYDTTSCSGNIVTNANPGDVIYICAIISDPFGEADIETLDNTPDITITDPDAGTSYTPSFSEVVESPANAATKTYQWQLTIPPAPPGAGSVSLGNWDIQISAAEGEESVPVTHTANHSFTTENIPNLSTSTKSVVNINGGDADPGDVLEYTISIIESGGTAIDPAFVIVTDPIPANTTYVPASTIVTGGGTGTLVGNNIVVSDLLVSAGETATVVFRVTIDAGTPPGTIIDNTATVSNPDGPGANPKAPSIIVSQSQFMAGGTKKLYLNNLNTTPELTRNNNLGNTLINLIGGGGSVDIDLTPILQEDLTLTSGAIPISLWAIQINDNKNARTVDATLSYSGPASGTIGTDSTSLVLSAASRTLVPLSINLVSDLTLLKDSVLSLRVTNSSSAANQEFNLFTDDGASSPSFVGLDSNTLIAVESVKFFNDLGSCGAIGAEITSVAAAQNIHVQAVVVDPFGDFDIEPGDNEPDVIITPPGGGSGGTLTSPPTIVADADAARKTFNWCYTAGSGDGTWQFDITAYEGTEGTISHTGIGTFTIGVANFTTSTKTVTEPPGDTDPGDILTYTINVINSGTQPALVDILDSIPANTSLVPLSVMVSGTYDAGASTETGPILDIQDLTVAAGATETVIFQVQVDGGVAPGTQIQNSASIITTGTAIGTGVEAPVVVISQSQLAGSGSKNLYLFNLTGDCGAGCSGDLTRTEHTTDSTVHLDGAGDQVNLVLTPATSAELTLGAGLIQIPVWLNGANKTGERTIDATLSYSGPASGTIGNQSKLVSLTNNAANIILTRFEINLPSDLVLATGTTLTLNITNNSGAANREIDIHAIPVGETINSSVSLNANTVINVESVTMHSSSGEGAPVVTTANPGDTVFIQALVSDPFGDFDIEPVDNEPDVVITSPVAGTLTTPPSILPETVADLSRKTFEWQLDIPPGGASNGNWTIDVTAKEGLEASVTSNALTNLTVGLANFSTSTKTVTDINGGDVEPGDTLRYTITIIETGGAPGTARILDTIDTDLTNLNIITDTSNWTENSTTLPLIDLADIPIAASGSETLVYEVNVAPGTVVGAIIDNIASIIAAVGENGSAEAPNLIVLESTLSVAGTKLLYLENLGGTEDLSRTRPTVNTTVTVANGTSTDIDLAPALATSLTLGGGDFTIFLWLNADAIGSRAINAQLRYFGTSSGVIDDFSQSVTLGNSLATGTRIPFTLTIPSDLTLLAGTQLRLRITNQSAGGGDDIIVNSFKSGDPDPYSQINLNANTVISVDSVTIFDAAHNGLTEAGGGNILTGLDPPATIYVRARISDPFGSFDINPDCSPPSDCPTIDIDDSTTLVVDDGDMGVHVYEDIGEGFRIYEFSHAVPGGAGGTHTFTVTGSEGEEATITDSGLTTLTVGIPDLTVTKDTQTGLLEFNSGDPVEYEVTITNDGSGSASNIVITDELDSLLGLNLEGYGVGIIFQLDVSNCATCSLGTERFTEEGGVQWAYTPGSSGIDTSVTEWELTINGEMDATETIILRYWTKID